MLKKFNNAYSRIIFEENEDDCSCRNTRRNCRRSFRNRNSVLNEEDEVLSLSEKYDTKKSCRIYLEFPAPNCLRSFDDNDITVYSYEGNLFEFLNSPIDSLTNDEDDTTNNHNGSTLQAVLTNLSKKYGYRHIYGNPDALRGSYKTYAGHGHYKYGPDAFIITEEMFLEDIDKINESVNGEIIITCMC